MRHLAFFALGCFIACGGKAIVDGQPGAGSGGGGVGGSGGTLTTINMVSVGEFMSSGEVSPIGADTSGTGPVCMETGSQHCNACVNGGCGTPQDATGLLVCNGPPSSHELYQVYFACLCGNDAMSGACGAKCSKTCSGTGTDSANCMTCLATALTGTCSSNYTACKSDQ